LDDLLAQAREAPPETRIELRDQIAAHGENAIEAMTDWLGDERLAAFAIRVLERIGREPANRDAVQAVLAAVDRDELPPHLTGDIEQALKSVGGPKSALRRRTTPTGRSVGSPGLAGRGYWVMRTSPWERPYIWAEAQRGRLRQGWGWNAEMNLDVIAETRAKGGQLSDEQQAAVRSRRMRTSEPDGMRVGDYIVAPNLPDWGEFSVFELVGSYEYSLDTPRRFDERFGHVIPVKLLAGAIDRRSPVVSDALRGALRPQSRLYQIDAYGGDVERALGRHVRTAASRDGEAWTESEYQTLFGSFPPDGARPTRDEATAMAAELRRSVGAVEWQWADGASYVSNRSASTTSDALKSWLDRQGRS
jgi:hypothetical protein